MYLNEKEVEVERGNGVIKIKIIDPARLLKYLSEFRKEGLKHYTARTGVKDVFSGGLPEVFPDLEAAA